MCTIKIAQEENYLVVIRSDLVSDESLNGSKSLTKMRATDMSHKENCCYVDWMGEKDSTLICKEKRN